MNQYQKNIEPFLNKNKQNNTNRNIAIGLLIILLSLGIYYFIK